MRHKKYILNAAKDAVTQKFEEQLNSFHDRIEELRNSKDHPEHSSPEDENCAVCDQIRQLFEQLDSVQDEWRAWSERAKKNKKKVGKQVQWTSTRESAPMKTVNRDALDAVRKARKEKNTAQVGIDWLYEGALVTQRGKADMMIVTQVGNGSVEVLHQGGTRWFRSLALRPASWLVED